MIATSESIGSDGNSKVVCFCEYQQDVSIFTSNAGQ